MIMERPPHLLILTPTDGVGGTQSIIVSLTRQLMVHGWIVRTILSNGPNSGAWWCREQGVDVETHPAVIDAYDYLMQYHGLKSVGRFARDMLMMRHLVRQSNPDVVNLHYGGSFVSLKDVIAVRLAGAYPCIASVHHSMPWDDHNEEHRRMRRMTRLAAKLCHAVIVPSYATRNTLIEAGVSKRKIFVVPNGLRTPTTTITQQEARARLGLPTEAFIVASLSRLVKEKGIADLIMAIDSMPDPNRCLLLVIGGDGPDRAAFEQLAMQSKQRVKFLGYIPDTADLYAAADVFALPSHMEGFGLVYVEAAFRGLPSIGTNIGGIPEVIIHERTGLLVPLGDRTGLATAIHRLQEDGALRRRLGDAARARALTEFSEVRMAEQYVSILIAASIAKQGGLQVLRSIGANVKM